MTSPLPMRAAATTLDDEAWEDLLNFIDERRVIPIIGPELLQVETETGPRLLYDWVAEKLAARLNVDTATPVREDSWATGRTNRSYAFL